MITIPDGLAVGDLVFHLAGVEVEAQQHGRLSLLVQFLHFVPLVEFHVVGGGHGEEGALSVTSHAPAGVGVLVHAAVLGVGEVVAFQAVVERIANLGVGVHQVQERQSLFRMLGVDGNEVHRAQHGVVGQDGGAVGVGDQFLAHVGAPNGLGGGGPALSQEAGLVGGAFSQVGSVGVDDAGLEPFADDLQLIHHVLLLENLHNLGLLIVVAHADAAQTSAEAVIHKGDLRNAVLGHGEGSGAGLFLDGLQDRGGVRQRVAVHGGLFHAQLLQQLHVPDEVLGDGGILVGRHTVDAAAHAAGVPVTGGNQLQQAGSVVSQQVGDVQIRAHGHVGNQIAAVAEDDVIGLVRVDDDAAAVAPVAPADAFHIQPGADLLFDVGVEMLDPRAVVVGLSVAQRDDLQGGNFLSGGEADHAQSHAQRQNQRQDLFHVCSLLFFIR